MNPVVSDCYTRLIGRGLLPFYETVLRGRNTFRYYQEFESNQWRTPEEVASLQWGRLICLLAHAYRTTDYYRSVFDAAGLRPEDIARPEDFARLPVLDKATVRQNREHMVSSLFQPAELIRSATGGSTGEPMQLYYDRNSYERRCAAAMRGDGWAGWCLGGGEFYLWGIPLIPQSGWKRWKVKLHHTCQRRMIFSSFDLNPPLIEEAVRRCNRLRPRVFIGYASALYEFARYIRQKGLKMHRPLGIITAAEKTYDYQRMLIEEVFRAPVFDRYGCREVMMIGAECGNRSGLHVAADNLYVEIVQNGRLCEPGETGEILLTDLHNYGMPLIRYRVGDIGSWKGQDCACGRGLPLMNVVEGRLLDVITTVSGRMIAGEFFPHLFKDFSAIRAYRVIQEQPDQLTIRIALDCPLAPEDFQFLQETISRTLGPEMHIQWEMGRDVTIDKERKFRPVRSHVPANMGAVSSRP
jgi:phenylacetate-CoA ligase